MLYPLHLLVSDAEGGWRVEALPHRTWRPTVLVPRSLCLFESMACAEIRLHELPGFARLQAQRLSPFERAGASAVRRSGRLLLWIWDAEEVEQAVRQAGLATRRHYFVAEALHLEAPSAQNSYVERAAQSTVKVACEGAAMLRSEVLASAPLDLSVIRPRPWAHNWLASWGAQLGGESRSLDWRLLVNGGAGAVAAAMFAFMAYQGGALFGSQRAVERLAAELDTSVAERRQVSALSKAVEADVRWLQTYALATRQLDLTAFMDALRPVLERQGVVLSELEANEAEVRIVAVTVGGEIRLPDLLADLGHMAGVRAVRLMQQDELKRATFGLQMESLAPVVAADGEGVARGSR